MSNRILKITITNDLGRVIATVSRPHNIGWSPLPRLHAGIWFHDEGLVLWNACAGSGCLYIGQIIIEFTEDVPATIVLPWGWSKSGRRLTIGTGSEFIAPRGSLRVRWKYPDPSRGVGFRFGARRYVWHTNMARTVFDALAASLRAKPDTNAIPTYGGRQTAPPGAHDRDLVPGWKQDQRGAALLSDLVMNRMNVGFLNQQTGFAEVCERDYRLTRGWTKHTQLQEFWGKEDGPWVTPIGYKPNALGPQELMLGLNRDNSAAAFDDQHLGNALGYVHACAETGDSIARFDRHVLAADAFAGVQDHVNLPMGGRARAWLGLSMWRSNERVFQHKPWAWAQELVEWQSPSGAFLRAPKDYPFSPTPQQYGMPEDQDCDALMERTLTCGFLAEVGRPGSSEAVLKAAKGQPWPSVNKFVAVGRNQAEIYDTYRTPKGDPDYFPWMLLGMLLTMGDTHEAFALDVMRIQPTPGGHGPIADRAALLAQLEHESVGLEQTAMVRNYLWQTA